MFSRSLSDLEATRDELLFEVHKMSQEEEGPKPDKTVSENVNHVSGTSARAKRSYQWWLFLSLQSRSFQILFFAPTKDEMKECSHGKKP